MQDQIRPISGHSTIGFAALAAMTALAMAAATLFARTGLGFPLPLLAACIAVVVLSTFAPALWALRTPERQVWVGPLAGLVLILACGVVGLLGMIGVALVCVLALGCLVLGIRAARPSTITVLLECAIVLAGVLFFALELGGTKYVNFVLDQLILHGRADGDDYLNAALTKSLSTLLVPAPGIDGVAPAKYHFGFYALAATLTPIAGGDAALALIGLQMLVLVPLLGFALAHGTALIAARLTPEQAPRPLLVAALAFALVPLAQLSGLASLVAYSTSMLLGGTLLTLLAPAILVQVPERADEPVGRFWWASAIAIPVLAVAKISAGYVWTAVAGYLALRKIGLKRLPLWLLGLAMAILFFGSVYLFAPTGSGGGTLFGTPYYVERGFAEGNYLLPLQLQWQNLAVLIGLILLRRHAADGFRKLLIEAVVIAIVAANLPGLLMQIPGGDAAYFLIAGEWFALPILLAALTVAPAALRATARSWRIGGWAVAAAAAIGLVVGLVDTVPLRAHAFVSAEALIHTGDRTYFSDHKKRALKADFKRALDDQSLFALMQLPVAEPLGRKLADQLRGVDGAARTGAIAFAAPDSAYWTLVGECDGRSLWPMAVAGVSMLGGQSAGKATCPDEGPLLGADLPDVAFSAAPTDDELCALAAERRFRSILVIKGLDEAPAKVECNVAISELDHD
ncbi:MAG TPA: hypothetical protein VJ790_11695 [Dongiaceae bacterium]|nr:hypothetical protein [Dongiaceae bacterium]